MLFLTCSSVIARLTSKSAQYFLGTKFQIWRYLHQKWRFAFRCSADALIQIREKVTWTVQSITNTQQRISDANQRIAIVESKLIRLDTDIAVLGKRPPTEHTNE